MVKNRETESTTLAEQPRGFENAIGKRLRLAFSRLSSAFWLLIPRMREWALGAGT